MKKLVRDLIPQIREQKGQQTKYYVAEEKEFNKRLFDKLLEEVNEFIEDSSIEEFADIMEVLETIRHLKKYSQEQIETARLYKKAEKGGFQKKFILEVETEKKN